MLPCSRGISRKGFVLDLIFEIVGPRESSTKAEDFPRGSPGDSDVKKFSVFSLYPSSRARAPSSFSFMTCFIAARMKGERERALYSVTLKRIFRARERFFSLSLFLNPSRFLRRIFVIANAVI